MSRTLRYLDAQKASHVLIVVPQTIYHLVTGLGVLDYAEMINVHVTRSN